MVKTAMMPTCLGVVAMFASVSAAFPDVPDNCFCSDDPTNPVPQKMHGAQCNNYAKLICAFGMEGFQGIQDTLNTIAKIPYVKDISIINEYIGGVVLNDPQYIEMGALLGKMPQLTNITVKDDRVNGVTLSDAGVSGFGKGLVNSKVLEYLRMDLHLNLGIGHLQCPNHTNLSSVAPSDGLAGLGKALAHIPTMRHIDVNVDWHNGGYTICDADVIGFAHSLKSLTRLEQLTLGLNANQVGDAGITALGQVMANLPLHGVNLRISGSYRPDEGGGISITDEGVTNLMDDLSKISTLTTLSLMLADGLVPLTTKAYDALGNGFAKMHALEYLWLYLGDETTNIHKAGLKKGLAQVKTLKVMHSDIHCLYCTDDAPWQCIDDGNLASVLHGKCVECNVTPRPDQCACWERQGSDAWSGCTECDRGNWIANGTAGCHDKPNAPQSTSENVFVSPTALV